MKIFRIILSGLVFLTLSSCDVRIVDAEYPSQTLYLPAAVSGPVFLIDKAYEDTGSTPTEGAPSRFVVDWDEFTFSVPLSVYRAGINNDGGVNVSIELDDNIIDDMFIEGDLDSKEVEILDMDLRDCPEKVYIEDGQSSARFNVVIDLAYLMDQSRFKKKFAFAVSIDSKDRALNPKSSKVVVVIDTKLFETL